VIHHVQLAAPPGSEPAARAFWGGALGFEEIDKPAALASRGGCWFRGHGIEIHVGVEDDFRPAMKAHPGLLLTDLDAWADRLEAAGYLVSWDAGFPGMRRFYTADPFGNRLEFLEPAGTLRGQ
jgi:catechol 2,3-dioxygenase-like lactoylglutathione lyase family enzyme